VSDEKAVFIAALLGRDPRGPKQQLQAASKKPAGVGLAHSYPTCTALCKARKGQGVWVQAAGRTPPNIFQASTALEACQ